MFAPKASAAAHVLAPGQIGRGSGLRHATTARAHAHLWGSAVRQHTRFANAILSALTASWMEGSMWVSWPIVCHQANQPALAELRVMHRVTD